jgi:HSP20 family molecular chaperone IbpA
MKNEFEKKMLIASELLSYCHLRGAHEFHINIYEKDDATTFVIKASEAYVSNNEMEVLCKKLNTPRHREIEQDFWALSGDSENTSELSLVGMMTDEAVIEYADGVLSITIKRVN